MKKISWKVTFIRGDAPEYGELSIMVFAASEELAKEHIISCYGPKTIIKEIK